MNSYAIWNSIDIKLIAILRGIKPEETVEVVDELINAGIRAIEIPLNSPNPFHSIESAVRCAEKHADVSCLIGAGTVLNREDVIRVKEAGGNLVVSPNVDETVIGKSLELEMFSAPGVYSPSECMRAIDAGAHCLKVFPANMLGPSGFKALNAVFGNRTELCAVGGIGHADFKAYTQAGASAFGLGSLLYQPGIPSKEIGELAHQCVTSFRNAVA